MVFYSHLLFSEFPATFLFEIINIFVEREFFWFAGMFLLYLITVCSFYFTEHNAESFIHFHLTFLSICYILLRKRERKTYIKSLWK